MITTEKYNEVLESGLLLDHYFLMCNMKNGITITKNKRIQGFINLLTKKEYIKDDVLTEKALDLIENCDYSKQVVVEVEKEVVHTNLGEWINGLHKRCEDRLLLLTGKRQVRDKIRGVAYAFLPNPTDLAKNIMKIITIYKIKDLEKIDRCIMKYIDTCNRNKKWFPKLYYYIFKEGQSQLVTDMDSIEDMGEVKEQIITVNPKDLFQ